MRQFYETYIEMAIVTPVATQLQKGVKQENATATHKGEKLQRHDIEKDTIVSSVMTQLELNDIRKTILVRLSWTQHLILMSRCNSIEEREFYLKLCIKDNYTVRELDRQISASLFERTMLSNTKQIPALNKIAPAINQHFKDSYVFEFLNLPEPFSENDLQKGLIRQMKKFILELGKDFLFVDEEYRLQVGNNDYRCDLLFYHRELRCLVAFELKNESFDPGQLGKINFYLEALDRNVKKAHENPSIGILLCKDKDTEVVEYALSRQLSPTLISQYTLALPDKKILQAKLRELFEMWNEKIGEE